MKESTIIPLCVSFLSSRNWILSQFGCRCFWFQTSSQFESFLSCCCYLMIVSVQSRINNNDIMCASWLRACRLCQCERSERHFFDATWVCLCPIMARPYTTWINQIDSSIFIYCVSVYACILSSPFILFFYLSVSFSLSIIPGICAVWSFNYSKGIN